MWSSYGQDLPTAAKWNGINFHQDYPQESNSPVITSLSYSLSGDTLINDIQYSKILFTHEAEKLENVYRGAVRQSADKQQVYFIPYGSNNEYLL